MRMHAKDIKGQPWAVVDAQTGLALKNVEWADDETHQVCVYCEPLRAVEDELVREVRHVPKVSFDHMRHVVLINLAEVNQPAAMTQAVAA